VHQRDEAAAGHQLHGEVVLSLVLPDLVDGDDARVVKRGDGLGLVAESPQLVVAGEQPGLDHLEGDGPVEAYLTGLVVDAHAAAPQLAGDRVVAEVADRGAGAQAVAVGPAAIGGRGRAGVGRGVIGGKVGVGDVGGGRGGLRVVAGVGPVRPGGGGV